MHGLFAGTFYFKYYPPLGRLRAHKVSCGANHVALIVDSGFVLTKGRNDFGQLGIGIRTEPRTTFALVEGLHAQDCIVDVAPGHAYTLATGESGALYGWGTAIHGRLGIQTDEECLLFPTRSRCDANLSKVSAGSMHGHALCGDGQLYSWGVTSFNGLGLSEHHCDCEVEDNGEMFGMQYAPEPTLLQSLSHERFYEVSIGPGGYHTLALTQDGRLYGWGHNRVGQLTQLLHGGEKDFYVTVPRLLRTGVAWCSAGWGPFSGYVGKWYTQRRWSELVRSAWNKRGRMLEECLRQVIQGHMDYSGST